MNNKPISIVQGVDHSNYICLTDMVRAQEKDVERVNMVIQNWMRRKDTIEYLGLWEHLNNPAFNDTEFDVIKNSSGSNRFILTVKEWNERTGAVGIIAKVGRYGGTYAHRDIAFNFGMWLSPELYLLVVKELQRLESSQNNPLLLQWDIKRILSKTNYVIHTDAIKNCIMPTLNIEKTQERIVYATEADMLNLVLFGCTARDWQEANPELAKKMNIRDTASINELLVLSNLESYMHQQKGLPRPLHFKSVFSVFVCKSMIFLFHYCVFRKKDVILQRNQIQYAKIIFVYGDRQC